MPVRTKKKYYAFQFYGPGDARGIVVRFADHYRGVSMGFDYCTESQANCIRRAAHLIGRNEYGDQILAEKELRRYFDHVKELPLIDLTRR